MLYRSSQYMVEMRYSCCTLSTGHRSLVISSSDFLCFWWITRNVTACASQHTLSHPPTQNSDQVAKAYTSHISQQKTRRTREITV